MSKAPLMKAICPDMDWPFVFSERRAHVPLGAGSRVTYAVEVVITGNHLNETAPSGYVSRLVVPLLFLG